MYDIHCHLIDGVDDGAKNIIESIQICRTEASDRVKGIIAAPHFMEGVTEIAKFQLLSKINLINDNLKAEDIDLTVYPGMEVFINPELDKFYESGRIICLNCKKYMLIELPVYGSIPAYIDHILFNLQLKGITPIIAHPERCRAIIKVPNIVFTLIDKGCLIQLNSGSLDGLFGKDVKKTAVTLLDHNMVHVIATDNHSYDTRMSSFRNCYRAIQKRYGKETAEDLFSNNPLKVINGENICLKEPKPIKEKKFWW